MSEDIIEELRNGHSKYTVSLPKTDLPAFLKGVKERLEKRVIGQERPIRRLMRGITTFYAGLNDPKRPIGVFMFAGPSGSGKTYLAEELAYALIGDPEEGLSPIVKIDCGSLSLEHTVASLTGSPPGYVGYGEKTNLEMMGKYDRKKKGFDKIDQKFQQWVKNLKKQLGERLKNPEVAFEFKRIVNKAEKEIIKYYDEPFRSVVLFDEIEKADMNIQSQLLRILDEGKLDLLNGRTVDFRGSIIILTTNVGTEQILSEHLSEEKIGFRLPHKETIDQAKNLDQKIYDRVMREIFDKKKRYFKPELLGRIGRPGVIVFHVLGYEDYQKILDIRLTELQDLLISDHDPGAMLVSYTQKFKDFLVKEGVSPVFGARALRNVIDKYVRVPISEQILSGQLKVGDKILLDVKYRKEKGEEVGYTAIRRQKRPKDKALEDFKKTRFESDPLPDFGEILKKILPGYGNQINGN